MIGLLWNMRGMGQIGRIPALVSKIKESRADFVGIMETKKESFSPGLLNLLLVIVLSPGAISLLKGQQEGS
jgi:hypothetical protein